MKDIWSGIAAAFILIVIGIDVNLFMHWLSRTEQKGALVTSILPLMMKDFEFRRAGRAILVQARAAEAAFVAEGYPTHRREMIFNDFVAIGVPADPAEVQFANTVGECFGALSDVRALFVSRGNDSDTYQRGQAIWKKTSVTPDLAWYRELDFGMSAMPNTTAAMGVYRLSERASWLNFDKKNRMAILFSRDCALQNQYAYLAVDPASHPHGAYKAAVTLENWLTSQKGQSLIGGYTIDGETLFTPNAKVR